MILADTEEDRRKFLEKLTPIQKQDFKEILIAMEGYPVTIRLLDAPLHEFLPNIEELREEIRNLKMTKHTISEIQDKERILNKAKILAEVNPMLGHRGVRVGITYPEIYESQIRALCEASAELIKEGVKSKPQIMIPQVALKEELINVRNLTEKVITEVQEAKGVNLDIKFGTMIEVVRACVTADEIADIADFFSFGTNDLTQATFSFSREDAENKFLPIYEENGIINQNPFQIIDKNGVAELMQIAVNKGRKSKGELEVGICGEHGGDPTSIEIFHKIGLTYVSCSPYRIPIAKLAASQAHIKMK
jgi:pyruvate,orthophosphate dikinase